MTFIHKTKAKRSNGFPSKLESAVHDILLIRENAKEISNIQRQQTVVLQDGAPDVRIAWKVDFSFTETESGKTTYAEAKGIEDEGYKLKLKLWRKNPPAKLEIWMGHYTRPKLVEVVQTKEEA